MGQVGVKSTRLTKKQKAILESRALIDDALDLDKRLKKLDDSLKQFDHDLDLEKDKEQKKVRDF